MPYKVQKPIANVQKKIIQKKEKEKEKIKNEPVSLKNKSSETITLPPKPVKHIQIGADIDDEDHS